ncbi:MAG TPA: type VI secretion system tube protein Hcp [Puia sp.]
MKAKFCKYFLALLLVISGYTIQAQIIRPITPAEGTGGGIWLSGQSITADGTGIHAGETLVLAMEDSIMNTFSQATGGGAGAGKIVFGDLKFRRQLNANSLPFVSAVSKGSSLGSMKFSYYEKNAVVLSITVTDVIITKYKVFSSDCTGNNCAGIYEEISLSYKHMQYADGAGHTVSVF